MPIERIRSLRGAALPLRGDNIDTDRIIPARFLRSITFEGLEEHLFEDDRRQRDGQTKEGRHPVSDPSYASASILLVNANFGCGSSREHAPQAIRRRGFRGIIGQSYSEIFFGNAVAMGMPCVTASAADVENVMAAVEREPSSLVELDLDAMQVTCGERTIAVHLPPGAREAFRDGSWDATGLLLERYEEVDAAADRLPYLRWS
ncbi:3-isopropylmalate dehydratase small subunit [soil metagenome]|nr:3-isopropylmalate dehydratase small subunit [Acidobacteriota bacterium]